MPTPVVKDKGEEAYAKIKSELVQIILNHRLYKEEDLNVLFSKTILYN